MTDRKIEFTVTMSVDPRVKVSQEILRQDLERTAQDWADIYGRTEIHSITVQAVAERPETTSVPTTTPSAPEAASDVLSPTPRAPGHIPAGTGFWEALRLLSEDLITLRDETREDLQHLDRRMGTLETRK